MMPLLKLADALPFTLNYKLVTEAYHQIPMTKRYH